MPVPSRPLRLFLACLCAAGMAWGAAPQARIYWLEFTGLHSANADGSDAKTLVPLNDGPDGVAVDAVAGKIYWTNMGSGGNGSVQRSNLDGSKVEYVVPKAGTYFAKQIQLDLIHGKAYWSDRDGLKIQRCNLDGSQNEVLISGVDHPVGMALDTAGGVFYFSEKDGGTLKRAPMAMPPAGQTAAKRTDVETLISGLDQPIDVGIDLGKKQIYWTDRDEGTVHRAGIEIPAGQTAATRKDIETLMRGLNTPIGIALDLAGGKLFTTESGTGAVWRANLDGTGKEAVIPARAGATLTGICFVPAAGTQPVSLPSLPIRRGTAARAIEARVDALGQRRAPVQDGRTFQAFFPIPGLFR
ncbi:MAG: 3-hydroxyacyl-CoA dehydrogenase [Fibrobacteres bacterium]|jgi:sugar lactone lactonase YvrE|nr:3-hydroxyacyl-CoA dehydrogenase [Fibrobacterota bacterium]